MLNFPEQFKNHPMVQAVIANRVAALGRLNKIAESVTDPAMVEGLQAVRHALENVFPMTDDERELHAWIEVQKAAPVPSPVEQLLAALQGASVPTPPIAPQVIEERPVDAAVLTADEVDMQVIEQLDEQLKHPTHRKTQVVELEDDLAAVTLSVNRHA